MQILRDLCSAIVEIIGIKAACFGAFYLAPLYMKTEEWTQEIVMLWIQLNQHCEVVKREVRNMIICSKYTVDDSEVTRLQISPESDLIRPADYL